MEFNLVSFSSILLVITTSDVFSLSFTPISDAKELKTFLNELKDSMAVFESLKHESEVLSHVTKKINFLNHLKDQMTIFQTLKDKTDSLAFLSDQFETTEGSKR